MKVDVFTITYNEELILPYFIKHYRSRFPDCNITIYDNYSTDNTVEIAIKNGCIVFSYDTNNEIRDDAYLSIKNRCWKKSNADWVFVVDCDEFVDVTLEQLQQNFNIIKAEGWDMIGETDNVDNIDSGIRSSGYDKICAFKPYYVEDINYDPGCHSANPKAYDGRSGIIFNSINIKLWHFKWLNWYYTIYRYKLFNQRLSQINKENGWGIHYSFNEDVQKEYYESGLKNKIKVRWKQ